MVISALHRKLLRDLRELRAQVLTTGLLIACGVALFISSWSAFESLQSARDRYYISHSFADLFAVVKRAPVSVADKIARLSGVDVVEPRIVLDGLIEIPGNSGTPFLTGRFVSIPDGRQPTLNQLHLRKGRLPREGPEVEAVLHEGFAEKNRIEPGSTLVITTEGREEQVRVVGIGISPEYVYALSPAAPLPDDRHFGILWVPHPSLEQISGMRGAFNSLTVRLVRDSISSSNGALRGLTRELEHQLEPYGNLGVQDRSRQSSSRLINEEIAQQRASAFITPVLFIAVAAFLIHVLSGRLIALQRSQIATLKALGFTRLEIATHYLQLLLAMGILGTLPGILLGNGLGRIMARSYRNFFRFPELDFDLSLLALTLGIAAGILPTLIGGASNILRAARLPPAEAMRPAGPASFRGGLVKTGAWQEKLSVRHRMLLRNLLSHPARLLLTILGLSSALALVVMSMSWNDIITFMLETQFQRVQREDLSIQLLRPVGASALQEIGRLESVREIEALRSVPVRLRHRQRQEDLVLTGWPASSRIRKRLDFELRTSPLPADGILLSRRFEKSWNLHPGDSIELEVLEGDHRRLNTFVAGFSDDLLGVSASARAEVLWRLLGESRTYSSLFLRIAPDAEDRLHHRLGTMPHIAGILSKRALLDGFQQTMGTMIRNTTLILVSFALAISLGVSTSSLRTSYSERSWQMATLRVLGLDRRDVFRLLTHEVALQLLLSILPGLLLGIGITTLILNGIESEDFSFPVIIESSTHARATLVLFGSFLFNLLLVRRLLNKMQLEQSLKVPE